MLEALRTYYTRHGILSTSFTCSHKHHCEGACTDFTGPKSAFVGTGYERGELPRLLFVSLDSGSGEKISENRLPEAVRIQEEINCNVLALSKHKHWYRTHELAWYILRRFAPGIKLTEAKIFFAHANSAKCCMNKPQRKKANATLFRNCRGYLAGELEILRPDIIVTQGNEAKIAILPYRKNVIDEFAAEIEIGARKIFWLHTYHPSNWGAFNKQRRFNKETQTADGWSMYSELIHAFIKNA